MTYFRIRNFEKFQQYRDDRPIHWLKLHLSLLDDYEFGNLPDVSKAHLMQIWILAGKLKNKIPNDAKWVAVRINATEGVDLEKLLTAGFIEEYDDNLPSVRPRTNSYGDPNENVPRGEERREEKEESRGEGDARAQGFDDLNLDTLNPEDFGLPKGTDLSRQRDECRDWYLKNGEQPHDLAAAFRSWLAKENRFSPKVINGGSSPPKRKVSDVLIGPDLMEYQRLQRDESFAAAVDFYREKSWDCSRQQGPTQQ